MPDWNDEFLEDAEFSEDSDALRSALLEVGSYYGLTELSRSEVTESKGEVVRHEVITKGLLTDEDRHVGAWLRDLSEEFFPRPLRGVVTDAREAEQTHVGDKYFLVQVEGRIYGFNVDYYHRVSDLAKELGYYVNTSVARFLVNEEKRILILESEWLYLAVAGLSSPNMEEEERVILSNRLASSQPFFSFKSPVQVDWSKLKGEKDGSFQRLCEALLAKDPSIRRIIPIGKSRAPDGGRDFEAHEIGQPF